MIKYGLISECDASIIERTIDLVINEDKSSVIQVTEVGIYAGETGNGIREYIKSKNRQCYITGVDNNRDNEVLRFSYDRLLIGDSSSMADKIINRSQHLVIIDACHCLNCVIQDHVAYQYKVKNGFYIAFHDAGKHIQQFKDYQHGDIGSPDSYISVRKALTKMGLFSDGLLAPFKGVYDDGDENNPAGGFAVFKKLY